MAVIISPSERVKEGTSPVFDIIFDGLPVGFLKMRPSENIITLEWVEIDEKFQHQGLAKQAMDYLCDHFLSPDQSLEIRTVNEEILKFYLDWFTLRSLKGKEIPTDEKFDECREQCREKFDSCVNFDGPHPVLTFKHEILSWKPDIGEPPLPKSKP